jgi:hypothetical protein
LVVDTFEMAFCESGCDEEKGEEKGKKAGIYRCSCRYSSKFELDVILFIQLSCYKLKMPLNVK